MQFVTVFNLQDGFIDALMGPFADIKEAMDWIDQDSLLKTTENPAYTRESSEECVMVSDMTGEEPIGYFYQILEPSMPAEVVEKDNER